MNTKKACSKNRSSLIFIAISCLLFISEQARAAEFGATRKVELTYIVKVRNVPSGTMKLNLWAPLITSDQDQTITSVRLDSPYPVETHYDQRWGNGILFMSVNNPEPEGFTFKITYKVERREVKTGKVDYKADHGGVDAGLFRRYLLPSRYAVINEHISKYSEEATAEAKTTMEKARSIYEFILSKMKYDKKIPGWGKGDVNRICLAIDGGKSGAGNCTDFHSFFGSLMRVQNIPVVFEMGYPLEPGKDQAEPKAGGYHCWAKFFIPGYGWIPVDISEASKDMSKKEYFFGAICENRIKFSRGRDVQLVPPQEGERLNYFGPDPYIEVDGKPFKGFERLIAYKNL